MCLSSFWLFQRRVESNGFLRGSNLGFLTQYSHRILTRQKSGIRDRKFWWSQLNPEMTEMGCKFFCDKKTYMLYQPTEINCHRVRRLVYLTLGIEKLCVWSPKSGGLDTFSHEKLCNMRCHNWVGCGKLVCWWLWQIAFRKSHYRVFHICTSLHMWNVCRLIKSWQGDSVSNPKPDSSCLVTKVWWVGPTYVVFHIRLRSSLQATM